MSPERVKSVTSRKDHQKRPRSELVQLSFEEGQVITDSINQFSDEYEKENGVQLDSDSWYHDSAVWILRQRILSDDGTTTVRRVQTSVFDSFQGLTLVAMPDAYVVTSSRERIKSSTPRDRLRNDRNHRKDWGEIMQLDKEQRLTTVKNTIKIAFRDAQK